MRRGRPRHDDVLTPREWEVLGLLREGLTNEQIAGRLGVSYDTAKFHVSEILGKLGVESRHEAAMWRGRPRVAFGLAPLLGFLQKSPPRRIAGTIIGVTTAALVLLAAGVLIMNGRDNPDDDDEATAPTPAASATLPATATTPPGPTPTPDPAPRDPAYAPDGRTGEARLDAIIEDMLTADAATLAERYGRAEVSPDFGGTLIAPGVWTRRLAAAQRRLHAVFRREVHQDIYLEVVTDTGSLEGWQVIVQVGNVLDIRINSSEGYGPDITPGNLRALVLPTPDLSRNYAGYLVLPPQAELPQPPAVHALATLTGEPAVDGLLALVQAGDTSGLVAAVATPDALRVRQCEGNDTLEGMAYVEAWADEAIETVRGVQSVARVPEGFFPPAGHIIVFTTQVDRFWWQVMGVLEQDGKVVALITGDACTLYTSPDGEYYQRGIEPGARNLLIAPPANGTDGLDANRNSLRTGVPLVDAILDAIENEDRDALAGLITYSPQECNVFDYAPPCPDGVAPGTPVDVLSYAVCHGGSVFPAEAPATVIGLFDDLAIYAVVGTVPDRNLPPELRVIEGYSIVLASKERGGTRSIGIGPDGVSSISGSCGDHHPEWSLGGGEPDYLLAPP